MSFGEELRRRRLEHGWSLRRLAQEVHVSYGYLSKIENGYRAPSPELAHTVDDALGAGGELEATADRPSRPEEVVRPAQLPAAQAHFVGRTEELRRLDAVLAMDRQPGSIPIVAIEGPPGAGKTALGLHWAHRVQPRFPDGCLFTDLRGYGSGAPSTPGDVLEHFLRELGVQGAAIPDDVPQRAARFRSLLHGRRMLIVLDNVRDTGQVLPLLPGSGSAVVVTTRTRLSGLFVATGAVDLVLRPLPSGDAVTLLGRVAGQDRIDAEPAAAQRIIERCAGLPLPCRIAAEQIVRRPHSTLRAVAEQLAEDRDMLDMLAAPDDSITVRRVLRWSYRALESEAARGFRLLGLHACPELTLGAAAALLGVPPERARRVLGVLTGAHLLAEVDDDRYRFHDFVWAYAAECAEQDEPPEQRAQAVRRVLEWYVVSTANANQVLRPLRGMPEIPAVAPDIHPMTFDAEQYDEAWAWCAWLVRILLALQRQARDHRLAELAWLLPTVNFHFFFMAKGWDTWIEGHQSGLEAARGIGDARGAAWCLRHLGRAAQELRRYDEALEYLTQAQRLWGEVGDDEQVGWAAAAVGALHNESKDNEAARTSWSRAFEVFEGIGNTYGAAIAQMGRAEADRKLGRLRDAEDGLNQALATLDKLEAHDVLSYSLVRLARTALDNGQPGEAVSYFDRAIEMRARTGDRWAQAEAWIERAAALRVLDRDGEVQDSLSKALVIYEELADPRADEVRAELAALDGKHA